MSNMSEAYAAVEDVEDACECTRKGKSLDGLADACRDAASSIEQVRDQYQDGYDNMPQGFQDGKPGQASQEKIDALTECAEALESAADDVEQFESEMGDAKAEDGKEGDAKPDGEAAEVNDEMGNTLDRCIDAVSRLLVV
jgi:uncharacterized protein YukE